MKAPDQSDIPGTRRSIEMIATKFNIYFLLGLALASGLVFAGGLLQTPEATLEGLPDSVVMAVVGLIGFSLFFPWFIALYFARHLLISIRTLESELALIGERLAARATDVRSDECG